MKKCPRCDGKGMAKVEREETHRWSQLSEKGTVTVVVKKDEICPRCKGVCYVEDDDGSSRP